MTYREADLGRVRTVPVGCRRNKVDPSLLASPPGGDQSFDAFLDSLPDVLAARDLRAVIAGVVAAARAATGVVLLVGGHVIKVGLGPLLRMRSRRGVVTHVALNGAAAIHDFELAAFGGTSEDVESGLADGTFGMAEETGAEMNAAIAAAARADQGMGEGLARALAARSPLPGRRRRCSSRRHGTTCRLRCTRRSAPKSSTSTRRPTAPPSAPPATGIFAGWPGRCPTLRPGGRGAQLGQRGGVAGGVSQGAHDGAEPRRRPADSLPGRRFRHAAPLPAANERGAAPHAGRRRRATC